MVNTTAVYRLQHKIKIVHTLYISLLLLFRFHLGLNLGLTLCSSIIPFMELCLALTLCLMGAAH